MSFFTAGRQIFCVQLVVVLCLLLCAPLSDAADGSVGRQIEDFTLADYHGQPHGLAEIDSRLVVVVFLGVECPLATVYAPRLVELAKQYESRGVAFLAINSNRQDSNSELAKYARDHLIPFPVLKDPGNQVADHFAAERTPEVFVLDERRVVQYQGRIDDQYGVGSQRAKMTEPFLSRALDELLANQEVGRPFVPAVGCYIGRMRIGRDNQKTTDVTWSRQVSRIFQNHCQECHRPQQLAPFSLLTYDDVLGWAETIREVVTQERMPPWNANRDFGHFSNDLRLSDDEKSQIVEWVDAGAPEGDPGDLPPARTFVAEWRIPTPDQIVYMSPEAFAVPAEGIVDYQWFYVNPGFAEDKWVRAIEARPGCREVVHHVTVYYKPPGGEWDMKMNDQINLLGGFNPGGEPLVFPDGMAMHLPAGTEFAFEMHYTPNGTPRQDRSFVGLCFADPKTIRQEVHSFMPADTKLAIPPGDGNYRSVVTYPCRDALDLLVMRPHMHLRGKSFRYEALYADGSHEILLDVPRFDFNWQHSYFLQQPKRLPAGTRLKCTAYFDNSAENPANPDPQSTVHWGDQSWDEMMIGIFCGVFADQSLTQARHVTIDRSHLVRWSLYACGAVLATFAVIAVWNRGARKRRT